MDSEANKRDILERMLHDANAEPIDLPLSLLKAITKNFSNELQIGSGGFADVYKGLLRNGKVAVKKLFQEVDIDEKNFTKELHSLISVRHKNIVRFLGYCSDTQVKVVNYGGNVVTADVRQRVLCFEFLPNGSLDQYITDASQGLEWRVRYKIIKGICEGLHYLHQKKIVHLDLKPTNILLDSDMVPKIADFGLSRRFDENQTHVMTSTLVGSLGYLAPEFYRGEISFKSDMYSLGVIIIEILTGKKGHQEITDVLESWSNRFGTTQGDKQVEQVRVCAEIGTECMDSNPKKRPNTHYIIDTLDEMEYTYGNFEMDLCASSTIHVRPETTDKSSKSEIIKPSASGYKLLKIQENARLIIEELAPSNLGYVEEQDGGRDVVEMASAAAPGMQERVAPHSGPLSKKSGARNSTSSMMSVSAPLSTQAPRAAAGAASSNDDDEYVEITLDVRDDPVAMHNVKSAAGGDDSDVTLEKRSSSFGDGVIRNASAQIKQVSQELRQFASVNRPGAGHRVDQTKSAIVHALKGLRFINRFNGTFWWDAVEKKFNEVAENGLLHRSKFGKCIGMNEPEFAGELFDVLARRRNISGDSISKGELLEFWDQISDSSFDSRLQIFFDMVDKDADGRITEDDVKGMIRLSASMNKLWKIKEQAAEYARLMMEELDPSNLGYIELYNLEMLLLQAPSPSVHIGSTSSHVLSHIMSQRLRPTAEPNTLQRWYRRTQYLLEGNWKRKNYKKYDILLLIGLGMSAMRMIPIIKDIVSNTKKLYGNLESGGGDSSASSSSSFCTRRAYCYWLMREDSLQWFRSVMDEAVETDKMGVIEFHNYCTSIYEEGDARSVVISMLQSLNYDKHGVDVVSGTRVKAHFAFPNWREVFKSIAISHGEQRVGVFYSGAPVLTKELRDLAQDFSTKTTTKFEFHNNGHFRFV